MNFWTVFFCWDGWPAVTAVISALALTGVVIALVQVRETLNHRPKWGVSVEVVELPEKEEGISRYRIEVRLTGNDTRT